MRPLTPPPEREDPYRAPEDVREDAMTRVLRRGREAQERRRAKIEAQHGEPLWKTLGRVVYVSLAVILDGPILLEIVRVSGFAWTGWALYAVVLAVVVPLQVIGYKRWFDVDVG